VLQQACVSSVVLLVCYACADRSAPKVAPTPAQPVAQNPTQLAQPAVADAGQPDELVNVRDIIPDISIDMRYATENNFAKTAFYPENAPCLLRRAAALALYRAQRSLQKSNMQLHVWDCYRPFSVQEKLWKLVPKPRFVARPQRVEGSPAKGSKHNRGAAIDLTLKDQKGHLVEMPSDHDEFGESASLGDPTISPEARRNAELLKRTLENAGFEAIDSEWWHFDYRGWENYELLDSSFH
jgi:D-alanyl-D-alanine dipeptidase